MRLLSSDHAPLEVLALAAGPDLSLSELAKAIEVATSAAQRALAILVDDGVVERTDAGKRYRLAQSSLAEAVVNLSRQTVPMEQALVVSSRASPAIEFAGLNGVELILVLSSWAGSGTSAPAVRALEGLCVVHGLTPRLLEHDDVRRELLSGNGLRNMMRNTRVLFGEMERSFPDRGQHAAEGGRLLGRAHPDIKLPSTRFLRGLARRHGVSSIQLFGSAVRSDLRPDSDVDVLIRYRHGSRPTLDSLTDIEHSLEKALGRDVDIVRPELLRPEVAASVRLEAVELL